MLSFIKTIYSGIKKVILYTSSNILNFILDLLGSSKEEDMFETVNETPVTEEEEEIADVTTQALISEHLELLDSVNQEAEALEVSVTEVEELVEETLKIVEELVADVEELEATPEVEIESANDELDTVSAFDYVNTPSCVDMITDIRNEKSEIHRAIRETSIVDKLYAIKRAASATETKLNYDGKTLKRMIMSNGWYKNDELCNLILYASYHGLIKGVNTYAIKN